MVSVKLPQGLSWRAGKARLVCASKRKQNKSLDFIFCSIFIELVLLCLPVEAVNFQMQVSSTVQSFPHLELYQTTSYRVDNSCHSTWWWLLQSTQSRSKTRCPVAPQLPLKKAYMEQYMDPIMARVLASGGITRVYRFKYRTSKGSSTHLSAIQALVLGWGFNKASRAEAFWHSLALGSTFSTWDSDWIDDSGFIFSN